MTALIPLTARLRTARLALVVPAEIPGADAADFAVHGADLLILSRGRRSVETAVEALEAARERTFPLPTLIAADDRDVAMHSAADVVFLNRPGWHPFGHRRPHRYSLFGRSVASGAELTLLDGDPFVFGFLGPAVTASGVNPEIAAAAVQVPPLSLPAGPVWFAAGAITGGSVGEVLAAGARRVAVSDAVFRARDPFAECKAIAGAVADAWRADPLAQVYSSDAFGG